MELRHLRYMLALAEHRSFTRAANAVHVTQSTLSHQIRQLELEIGRDLFDRSGREVTLTEAGEALLPGVRRALDELNGAILALGRDETSITTHVRVIVGSRACARLLLAPVLASQASAPVGVQIEEAPAPTMPERLSAEGRLFDLVLGDVQHLPRGWRFDPLYTEEVGILVPTTHRFAGRRRIRVVELHGETLVLPMAPCPTRLAFDQALEKTRARPCVIAELSAIEAMFELAVLRAAMVITPRNMHPSVPGMTYVPLEDPAPMRTVGFMWRGDADVQACVRTLAERIRKRVHAMAAANDGSFAIQAYAPLPQAPSPLAAAPRTAIALRA